MKIFIAADLEGATGVVHHDQLMPDGRGYAAAQRLLTDDINAAIEGALRIDPNIEFVVGDGHGPMRNVLLTELNASAELVIGSARPTNKPLCQLEGIDTTFDIAFMIGYHSMAGTPNGLLAHTYIGSLVKEWRLNGQPVGEVTMNAAICATFGVPVGLVVGNSDLEPEVRALDADLRFVTTKRTLGPTAAICSTPARTRVRIAEAASEVVRSFHDRKRSAPTSAPAVIDVETYRREQAERAAGEQGIIRVGDAHIRCEAATAAEAFRVMWRGCTRALDETPAWLS